MSDETEQIKYTSSHVANFFLDKAEKENIPVTPMKLQKLVYIGYGWVLAVLDRKLFDEPIEAWMHGPVIPSLYHEFKRYGASSILDKSVKFDLDNIQNLKPSTPRINKHDSKNSTKVVGVLDVVWDSYKLLSAWVLRNKTHEKGTPWSEAYENGNECLDDSTIKGHFHRKITEYLNG
uniref:Uncharacterized phage-associated protein n=1 Tax=Candidatus Kentrum sp. TUN TaxID=2126343 RepID=A0A451A377_9GAMM|nr:MAG: Uncharacterized phage-associated protein [Candidatus Kentron sp. TUN]VFK69807.1 MAG: Uncharacterized phage-associated protein [Candidatus Kentron sp. TUN]